MLLVRRDRVKTERWNSRRVAKITEVILLHEQLCCREHHEYTQLYTTTTLAKYYINWHNHNPLTCALARWSLFILVSSLNQNNIYKAICIRVFDVFEKFPNHLPSQPMPVHGLPRTWHTMHRIVFTDIASYCMLLYAYSYRSAKRRTSYIGRSDPS